MAPVGEREPNEGAHGGAGEALPGWPPRPPRTARLADAAGVLTAAERARVVGLLGELEKAQGDEVWIAVSRLPHGSSPASAASAIYARWGLAPAPPRATVLVFVDVASRQAAIETGQGVEGPLTSVEATRLVDTAAAPLRQGAWAVGLEGLARGVVTTAAATRARRRPPSELGSPEDQSRSTDPEGRDAPSPPPSGQSDPRAALSGEWGWFTRLAALAGAALIFLLALRQRKKAAQDAAETKPLPPRKKYLGPPRIDR